MLHEHQTESFTSEEEIEEHDKQIELFMITQVEAMIEEDCFVANFPQLFIPALEPGLYGFWFTDISEAETSVKPYLLVFEIVKSHI